MSVFKPVLCGYIGTNIKDGYEIGSVHYYPGNTVPSGFLLADGSQVSQLLYPDLYSVLGNKYGPATAGHFRLPNYGGYFLRFSDFGSGADPDHATRTDRGDGTTGQTVGTKQQDENLHHQHPIFHGEIVGGTPLYPMSGTPGASNTPSNSSGGSELRPININLMVIIKC